MEVTASGLVTQRFLHGMQASQLDALAQTASEVMLPAGHRIFAEGDYAGKFWLIESGFVALDVLVPVDVGRLDTVERPKGLELIGDRGDDARAQERPVGPAAKPEPGEVPQQSALALLDGPGAGTLAVGHAADLITVELARLGRGPARSAAASGRRCKASSINSSF